VFPLKFYSKTLEFDVILNEMARFSLSETAKNIILNTKPLDSIDEIKLSQAKIDEAMQIIVRSGKLGFIENYDIKEILSLIASERRLNISDIQYLRLFIKMGQGIKAKEKSFSKDKITYDNLKPYFHNIDELAFIISEIDSVMDPDGVILDNASEDLFKIRKEINKVTNKRRDVLNSLLQKKASILNESILVLRNDRYCLPVKTEFKNTVAGLIHDVSSSGTTTYIEPVEAAELSVSLQRLSNDETNEIKKILDYLCETIYPHSSILHNNLDLFVTLDVYFSFAEYSIKYDCRVPQMNTHGEIDLVGARHPLIDQNKVVPINIKLNEIKPILMITGPNTGGKTVALKTLGLLTIMAQSGLTIPAKESSKMTVFKGVYADIGDHQSIVQSLSTFSGHIVTIKEILDQVTDQSLILFDELGSGTDPAEGVALAKAILEFLMTKDIRMVLTTHYSELKIYAYQTPLIENASVKFDVVNLNPLYTIEYGRSGSSNALKIAQRLGLRNDVVAIANDYLKEKETDLSASIKLFEDKQEQLENRIKETILLEENLTKEKQILNTKIEQLEKEKQAILNDTKAKSDKLLEKIQSDAKAILTLLKEAKAPHEIATLKFELNQLGLADLDEVEGELKIGDHVFIKSYNQKGIIIDKKKDDYMVKFGTFELPFSASNLTLTTAPKPKHQPKQTKVVVQTSSQTAYELDLRGVRYEEVKALYNKFIDNAIIGNLKEVRIIHGYGTGAVKKALYECLKIDKNIESYRYGGEYEGQMGVTIVTLK